MAKHTEVCSICGEKAFHETIVSFLYLCDDERCWIEACRNEFIDGMDAFRDDEEENEIKSFEKYKIK